MKKQPICPKCKSEDNIIVETEMSGVMITPVRHGTIMESEQYFCGDTWEKVMCSACNIVMAVDLTALEVEQLI